MSASENLESGNSHGGGHAKGKAQVKGVAVTQDMMLLRAS
jgi:hypothetical protein